MDLPTLPPFLFLVFFLCISSIGTGSGNGTSKISCVENERVALLKLKQGFMDPMKSLSSWKGRDCCSWRGIACENRTQHVVGIQLGGNSLGGEISPSILELKQLSHFDLSMNDFTGKSIPNFIGSIAKLRYLNLSNAYFGGQIPHHLGNLSSLRFLDLGSEFGLSVDNLNWLSRLSSLQYLDMATVNLSMANDWMEVVNMLPSLSVLRLSSCQLVGDFLLSLSHVNLTSLTILDLFQNNITSTIPNWFSKLKNLEFLDLTSNALHGQIPDALGNMTSLADLRLQLNALEGVLPRTLGNLCNLRTLVLSWNNFSGEITDLVEGLVRCPFHIPRLTTFNLAHNLFSGPIPPSLGKFSTLTELFLQYNNLNGTVPHNLGQLSELNVLDVSSNSVHGVVSEAHFANLTNLKELYLSLNTLTLVVSPGWIPPFQLNYIYLPSCQIGPRFPSWLRTQKGLSKLDLFNTSISDTLPDWFWNLSSEIMYLNLSQNQIRGKLPASLESVSISMLDLSANQFEGSFPRMNPNILVLRLDRNSLSGTLPRSIGKMMPMLRFFVISSNLISGSIPLSICKMEFLEVVVLSNNLLSGQIPRCWNATQILKIIDMGNNELSGSIPDSLGSLTSLLSLHLNNNSLSGEVPQSFRNCKGLLALDLGENKFSGEILPWISSSLPNLVILRLRSNEFTGNIPLQLSHLTSLQVLDLAYNKLFGSIPHNFGNLRAMADTQRSQIFLYNVWGNYVDYVLVSTKGRQLGFSNTLSLVTSMDLSANNFTGDIPLELTTLVDLHNLNLSSNHLTGRIPNDINNLRWLESLDLSENSLSGPIPPSMASLTSLSQLNLSYNNLSGSIPSGFQLQTLTDPSIYIGNCHLCGFPLQSCMSPAPVLVTDEKERDESSDIVWFYISMAPGFVTGFWAVCGTLLLKRNWRISFFRLGDDIFDCFYVLIALKVAKLKNNVKSIQSFCIRERKIQS